MPILVLTNADNEHSPSKRYSPGRRITCSHTYQPETGSEIYGLVRTLPNMRSDK